MSFTTQCPKPLRLASCKPPLYDFLAPCLASNTIRTQSIASRRASTAPAAPNHDSTSEPPDPSLTEPSRIPKSSPAAAGNSAPPLHRPLTEAQRDFLSSAVSSIHYSSTSSKV